MKAQTFESNVIDTIFLLERNRHTRDPMNMQFAGMVVEIYRVARHDEKAMGHLDDLVVAIRYKQTDVRPLRK
jgi:hypothetical protein